MKKLIGLLLTCSMLLAVIPAHSQEEGVKYDAVSWGLLEAIEVIDDIDPVEKAEETVTRSDFVIYLLNLFGRKEMTYSGNNNFSDVTEDDKCYNAVNLVKAGLMSDDTFRPNDEITVEEAIVMLLKEMGYSKQLQGESWSAIANRIGLPSFSSEHVLDYSDLFNLFYKALIAPLLKYEISAGGDKITFMVDDNKTILSEYFDIEIVEGIVTHNGTTSLYTPNKLLDGNIQIDEKVYADSKNLAKPWLGYKVRAYVDFTKDKRLGDIAFVEELSKKNVAIMIDAEDIVSVNERVTSIQYTTDDAAKSKIKKIDINANVIFNGRVCFDYKQEDFKPDIGSLILIDNDNDGVFEVVIIWSYETIFVDRISQTNKIIYNNYTYAGALNSLTLDEDLIDFDYDIFWEDEAMQFSKIQKYQVLLVAKSKDKDGYTRIEVSKTKITGALKSLDTTDKLITIDDKEYRFSPDCIKEYDTLSLGTVYDFYLDTFGNVAGIVKNTGGEYTYAYLYSVVYDDSQSAAAVKLFTSEADWITYIVTDKIRYNGKNVKPSVLIDGISNDSKHHGLTDGTGITARQVVKIKTEGTTLKEICTAFENAKTGDFNKVSASINYYAQNSSFDSTYYINNNTIIFGIPKDKPNDTDSYRVSPSLSWDKNYAITAYECDEYGDTAAIELAIDSSTLKKSINECVVLEVTQTADKDGYVRNVLRCAFGMFEVFDIEIEGKTDFSDVKKGDLINITTNSIGQITAHTKVYSWKDTGMKYSAPVNLHSDGYIYGKVDKIDPDNARVIMTVSNDGGGKQPLRIDSEEIIVKQYDAKRNRCDLISIYDLDVGDYLVMYSGGSCITSILKYKE